mmetsp:Transcript_15111/g.37135  ORF Transcript_15111/g.37135 Transcript_15111/m.37135 type:complete len:360 (-) Transcript_15111:320-1399(-)
MNFSDKIKSRHGKTMVASLAGFILGCCMIVVSNNVTNPLQTNTFGVTLSDEDEGWLKFVCPKHIIQRNLALFKKEKTTCPSEPWYWDWQESLSAGTFVYVEIGCNKGTDALLNVRAFTADASADIDNWLAHTNMSKLKPACPYDFERWSIVRNRTARSVRVYKHLCIEAARENALPAARASKKMKLDVLGLHVLHLAVSSSTVPTKAKFPIVPAGKESVGLGTDHSRYGNFYDVEVINVDYLVRQQRLERVDVLKVDTEGNDPLVLIGAVNTLTTLKPSYLQFENHGVGHWKTFDLKDVIDLLDGMSYTCFWATNSNKLIRITWCWSPYYNLVKRWSNVVCYHRSNASLRGTMEKYSDW